MRSLATLFVLASCLVASILAQDPDQTVVLRLNPSPYFNRGAQAPRSAQVPPQVAQAPQPARQAPTAQQPRQQPVQEPQQVAQAAQPVAQAPRQIAQPAPQPQQVIQQGSAPGIRAQTPVGQQPGLLGTQEFTPRDSAIPPQAPPVNIPPDVQNQLIKFFGLDSFGIPGLTGNHPNGFAGAVQEMRAAGIPIQGLPLEHVAGQPANPAQQQVQPDILAQANPNFSFNNIMQDTSNVPHSAASIPLPDAKPGDNGLIGLLSSSIRKLVKDCKWLLFIPSMF